MYIIRASFIEKFRKEVVDQKVHCILKNQQIFSSLSGLDESDLQLIGSIGFLFRHLIDEIFLDC